MIIGWECHDQLCFFDLGDDVNIHLSGGGEHRPRSVFGFDGLGPFSRQAAKIARRHADNGFTVHITHYGQFHSTLAQRGNNPVFNICHRQGFQTPPAMEDQIADHCRLENATRKDSGHHRPIAAWYDTSAGIGSAPTARHLPEKRDQRYRPKAIGT
jgi:hypothetical protein